MLWTLDRIRSDPLVIAQASQYWQLDPSRDWDAPSLCGLSKTELPAPVCSCSYLDEGHDVVHQLSPCWLSQPNGRSIIKASRNITMFQYAVRSGHTLDRWLGVGPNSVSSTGNPLRTKDPTRRNRVHRRTRELGRASADRCGAVLADKLLLERHQTGRRRTPSLADQAIVVVHD